MKFLEQAYTLTLQYPRLALVALTLVVFALVTPGNFDEADTEMRLQVTHWLWENEPQVAPEKSFVAVAPLDRYKLDSPGWCPLKGKHGESFAPYGLGQSVVMLPGDILSQWAAHSIFSGRMWTQSFVVNLTTFSTISVLSLLLSFQLLLLLGFREQVALGATSLLLVATSFLPYIQVIQENLLIYFCFVGALVFVLRAPTANWRFSFVVAGILAGFSLLIKLTNVLYLPGLLVLALWLRLNRNDLTSPESKSSIWIVVRETAFVGVFLGLPILAFVGVDRYYQFYRFGEFLTTYAKQINECFESFGYPSQYPFGYDFITGFTGPLFSPEKSIFLFDPFLVFLLVFVVTSWRRLMPVQALVLFCLALSLLGLTAAFATTYFWTGGNGAWGPRHHLVPVEVMCLVGFAFAFRYFFMFMPWVRWLILINVLIAIIFQVTSIPFSGRLENNQIVHGDPIRIPQLMRIRNLYHIAIGDFESAGLDYGSKMRGDKDDPDLFKRGFGGGPILFRYIEAASGSVKYLLIFMWSALFVAAVLVIGVNVQRALAASKYE